MSEAEPLPTSAAEAVISKLGGLTAVARAIESPISTVQGWKDRKKIPQEYWSKIIAAGEAVGVKLGFEDFLIPPVPATPTEAQVPERAA